MKALDIVRTPKGSLAMVTSVWILQGKTEVSVDFFGGGNPGGERNAWWSAGELVYIDSFPRMLGNAMGCSYDARDHASKAYGPAPEDRRP